MMKKKVFLRITCVLVIVLISAVLGYADDNTITLKNTFIEKYKNRVTITADFIVDKSHKSPNPPSKDGDLHVAGRSPAEIQLPVVAEIMNAKDFKETAVALVKAKAGTGDSVSVTGAWRLWCEHAGDPQVQGKALSAFDTTNPDHVFEIHPVTTLNQENLLASLKPIEGFDTKDAQAAFVSYEDKRSRIIAKATTTTLITPMAGYNYVEFIMQAYTDDQFEVEDGRFVFGNVLDLDEHVLVYKRRMAFVKDSEPEKRVQNLKKDECIHVVGIPRINLALLSWRARNAQDRPEALTWTLPYEMIVVAVYDDKPCQQ